MFRLVVVLAAIVVFTEAQVINPCTRNPGVLPLTTVVEGCNSSPCSLNHGQSLNIHMTFRAPRPLNNMVTLATSYLNLINMILPQDINLGDQVNTCNHLTNARCPVNEGQLVNFTLRLPVTNLPIGHIIPFEFRVVDHGPMYCVMVLMRANTYRGITYQEESEVIPEEIANA